MVLTGNKKLGIITLIGGLFLIGSTHPLIYSR